jgi:hypothetical protein
VADFKIALTSFFMAAFSGTPAMDERFHSTKAAREASRVLIETLVDNFTKLADLDAIREPIQARSAELQVIRQEVINIFVTMKLNKSVTALVFKRLPKRSAFLL